MHHVLRAAEMRPHAAHRGRSKAYTRVSLVDETVGSVHMGVGLCALKAAGSVDTHVQSYEKSFFVLEGEPVLVMEGRAWRLAPGACGLIPVGVAHAWLGPERGSAKWLEM